MVDFDYAVHQSHFQLQQKEVNWGHRKEARVHVTLRTGAGIHLPSEMQAAADLPLGKRNRNHNGRPDRFLPFQPSSDLRYLTYLTMQIVYSTGNLG